MRKVQSALTAPRGDLLGRAIVDHDRRRPKIAERLPEISR
jgi:hypothetical protein